jgi:gas vesicle protein
MDKKVKFTIYPSKWNNDGYTYCKIQDLSRQLKTCWDYFLHKQKDDIEIAIASYVDDMSKELYDAISDGREDFLRDHKRFRDDITMAVEKLEKLL